MGLKKQISSISDSSHADVYVGSNKVTTSYDFTPTPEDDYNQAAYVECIQYTGGPWSLRYTCPNGKQVTQVISTASVSSVCSTTASCAHTWAISNEASYNDYFSNYKYVSPDYVVCPGTKYTADSFGSYVMVCTDGDVVHERGVNLAAWVYRYGSLVAQADNGVKPSSRMGKAISALTVDPCIRYSSSDSLSLTDFAVSGHYNVYLDLLTSYCNSPSLYISGWQNIESYSVIVPGPSVSLTPNAASFTDNSTFNMAWTINNNGVGRVSFSLSKNCGGLNCEFVGYNEGSIITINEGSSYVVAMSITPAIDSTNTIRVTASYDDGYGMSCIAGRNTSAQCMVTGATPMTTVTSSPTTTTHVVTTSTTTMLLSTTSTIPTPIGSLRNVIFRYNVTDDSVDVFNCSFWINVSGVWKINQTHYNVPRFEHKTFILRMAPGMYAWTVNCSGAGTHNVFAGNGVHSVPGAPASGVRIFYVGGSVATTTTTTTTTTSPTTSMVLGRADLFISDIWPVGSSIYYTLSNLGVVGAAASKSSLTVDGSFVLEDSDASIAGGVSRQESFSYAWMCSGVSDVVRVCADSGHIVPESDETNNCRTETWTCPTTTTTTTQPTTTSTTTTTTTTTSIITAAPSCSRKVTSGTSSNTCSTDDDCAIGKECNHGVCCTINSWRPQRKMLEDRRVCVNRGNMRWIHKMLERRMVSRRLHALHKRRSMHYRPQSGTVRKRLLLRVRLWL